MKHNPQENSGQAIRDRLLNSHSARTASVDSPFAGEVIAALYRCQKCGVWWGSSEHDRPETRLIWRLVEPHSTGYLWQDYHGWYGTLHVGHCVNCGQETSKPDSVLRFDDQGQVVWPELSSLNENDNGDDGLADEDANPFVAYVSQSQMIDENMTAITAREAQRESNAWGYTADINDIRDEMNGMRLAFKDVVYNYAPILPPGWRVIADYDKWLEGKACAGFLHGEVQPDISLLIGGNCTTVAEIEMELDRLHHYVSNLNF